MQFPQPMLTFHVLLTGPSNITTWVLYSLHRFRFLVPETPTSLYRHGLFFRLSFSLFSPISSIFLLSSPSLPPFSSSLLSLFSLSPTSIHFAHLCRILPTRSVNGGCHTHTIPLATAWFIYGLFYFAYPYCSILFLRAVSEST